MPQLLLYGEQDLGCSHSWCHSSGKLVQCWAHNTTEQSLDLPQVRHGCAIILLALIVSVTSLSRHELARNHHWKGMDWFAARQEPARRKKENMCPSIKGYILGPGGELWL